MPEGPEIRVYATALNSLSEQFYCSGLQKLPNSKWKDVSFSINNPEQPLPPLTATWESHGKELGLRLVHGENTVKRYNFQMGLSGQFVLCSEPDYGVSDTLKKNTVLRLLLHHSVNERSFFLCLHDTRRYAKWNESPTWNSDKGPCPYSDPSGYVSNVLRNLQSKAFVYPIYEVLLNQKYFNGVGNYLRSVVLYRCGYNWNVSGRQYLENHYDVFFSTLFSTLEEAYEGNLSGDLPNSFYYPYGGKKFLLDKNKRKFYYD